MTPGPWTRPPASSLPLAGLGSLRVAEVVTMVVAEAVLGTAWVGWGEARGRGTYAKAADPCHPSRLPCT